MVDSTAPASKPRLRASMPMATGRSPRLTSSSIKVSGGLSTAS